eukprot:6176953-Pleurochrysis_carterae.AAC.2
MQHEQRAPELKATISIMESKTKRRNEMMMQANTSTNTDHPKCATTVMQAVGLIRSNSRQKRPSNVHS